MPDDKLKKVRIRDVGRVVTGKTPPTARKELFGEDFPFITPTDIRDFDTRYLFSTERGLSSKGYQYQRRYLLPRNAVCYVCIGSTIGKVCLTARESFTNQQINSLIVDRKCFDPMYVFYLLRFITPQIQTISGGSGSGKAILNKSSFEQIEARVHALPTQRKIAAILSAYDDLIENNTRRIRILEEMAQMIYREWFVKFRFPGRENVKMVESELGMIPEGWEVMKLSALVETQYGITKSASESEIGSKFVRGTDINKTTYIDWATVPYCEVDESELARYKLAIGDILVIRMADPGKVAIVEKNIGAVFGSYVIRLKIISDRVSPYYLFYFLLSDQYQGYITGASTGTTRKSASAGVITDINMVVPPRELRIQFDHQVMMLRQMLNNLLDRNANLLRTRDLLLPRLISGEIDVENLDIDTEGLGNG